MSATLLVVNFHSADLTKAAIESARSASSDALEVVVIDNSVSVDEAGRLGELDIDRLMIAESNFGYGAGVNRALDSCSGDFIIVSNPDVVFGTTAVDRLLEPFADERTAVTGPSFFWDEAMTWHLPPPETMEFREQVARNLGGVFPRLARRRDRDLLERRLDLWRATSSSDVRVLSGAVMAFRSDELKSFRFDERYRLYFEEVDLMRRLRKAGRRLRYVPGARVRHLWAQSSARNPRSAALFESSRRMFQRRWYGAVGDSVVTMTRGRFESGCAAPELTHPLLSLPDDGDYLIELADSREFVMAAGIFAHGGKIDLPLEAMRLSPLEVFCGRVVDLPSRSIIQMWSIPDIIQDAKPTTALK